MDDFGKQTQGEKEAILDAAIARLKEEEASAFKNKLVMVRVSKFRYQVVQLTGTDLVPLTATDNQAGRYFDGRVLRGPAKWEDCRQFIRDVLNGVEVIEP